MSAVCRCCHALTRPARIWRSHGPLRTFGTTQTASSEKLPATDWGSFKAKSSPSRGAGASAGAGSTSSGLPGLSKWARTQRKDSGGDEPQRSGWGKQRSSGGHRDEPKRNGWNRDNRPRPQREEGSRGNGGNGGNGQGFARRNGGGDEGNRGATGAGERRVAWGKRTGGQGDSNGRSGDWSQTGEGSRQRGFGLARQSEGDRPADRNTRSRASQDAVDSAGQEQTRSAKWDPVSALEMDDDVSGSAEAADGSWDRGHVNRRKSRTASGLNEDGELVRGGGRKLKPGEKIKAYDKQRNDEVVDKEAEQRKRIRAQEKERLRKEKLEYEEKRVAIPSSVTVSRLASIFGVKLFTLQTRLHRLGMNAEQQRPDYLLTAEQACDVALEFGLNPEVDDEAAFDIYPEPEEPGVDYPPRPPVVTIMGHVDHGKTTLLDALRNTSVAAGEAGGITQHIGAFSVPLKSLLPADAPPTDATITFLDTPGHAAFSAMRARGASVTDIVVLVVAADDGVMPQTREVLDLVRSEGENVGLVIAINKIDKPEVDINQVKAALLAENIVLEEDGGDVQSVKVSGLAKMGLDNLVETLSTLAELRELRARTTGKAEGYILESNVDRGMGRVATVLVTRGTLKLGSVVVAGQALCKVRRMTDHTRAVIKEAGPGSPVVISGWKDIPIAGDQFLESVNGEAEARKAIANRQRYAEKKKVLADLEVINAKRIHDRIKAQEEAEEEDAIKKAGGNVYEAKIAAAKRAAADARANQFKELRLVIKGDVSGTVEAVVGALSGIGNKEAGVKIIHTGVGEVGDWDVQMAEAGEGLVIGFNVGCSKDVRQHATSRGVELYLESVIYRLIESVREKTAALLPPKIESRTVGEATVIQPFSINQGKRKSITIAGSRVTNGTVNRHDNVRVLRGPKREQVFEGKIAVLKHLKRDVTEIRKGTECGIQIEGFDDVREGDEIITFKIHEVKREL